MKNLQNESEILRLVSEDNEMAFREIFDHYLVFATWIYFTF